MPKTAEEIAAETAAEEAAAATAAAEAKKEADAKAAADKAANATVEEKLAAALADADKWKALSRKNEADKISNAEKAKKWDDNEAANLTAIEKAEARAEAAEKIIADGKAAEATKSLFATIATEKKLADRKIPATALRGTTREEIEAHADELLALIPAPAPGASAEGQGDQGGHISSGEMSADDIVAKATAR